MNDSTSNGAEGFVGTEDDVQGHRVSSHVEGGEGFRAKATDDDGFYARATDAEGFVAKSADADDDVEGHRVSVHDDGGDGDEFRGDWNMPANEQGFRAAFATSDDEDDVEGHRMASHVDSQHEQEADRGPEGHRF